MKRWQKITGCILISLLLAAHLGVALDYIILTEWTTFFCAEVEQAEFVRWLDAGICHFYGYNILSLVDCCVIVFLFVWLWRKDKHEQNGGATFRQQLLLSAGRALWGEISPNVRAVAVGCNDKNLHLIHYLNSRPTEEDYESVRSVAGELIADFPSGTFVSSKEECIESAEPIKELDALDDWVYIRKERKASCL